MINHEGEGRDVNRGLRPTTIGPHVANPPVAAASAGRWDSGSLRDTLFLVTFLLLWLTVTPFVDLGRSDVLDVNTGGSLATMVASLGLTAALAMFLVQTGSLQALRGVASPALIVTLVWFAISAVLSDNADLAIRRLVLAVITLFQACAFLMLPRDLRHFARLLTIGALIVVAFCYFGVLFLPHLSIHQATDFAEPGLAGDWRGTFRHKNDAGGDMAIFIFIGLFAARLWNPVAGWSLVLLSAVFLFFSHSKSPTNLLPAFLLIPVLALRFRSVWMRSGVLLALPVFLCVITIGSVTVPAIRSVISSILSDPTFTGRDGIWSFALENTVARPLFGHGFQAFWGTSALVYNWSSIETWAMRASDAHNGFLNVSVMTGWVGLFATLCWVVLQPLSDLVRARDVDADLQLFFMRVWFFGLCLSSFESLLFAVGRTQWFMMTVAIFGLRLQTLSRLKR